MPAGVYVRTKHWKVSEEGRKNISKGQLKRFENPEEREKSSKAINKGYENPKSRENCSKAQLKRYQDPLQIEANRQVKLGTKRTLEQKENYSKGQFKRFQDPKERAKQSRIKSSEECEKISEKTSEANIKRWKNPEYIKNNSGKNSHFYGKQSPHSKQIYLHSTPFQGERKMHRWEHLYATYLDSIGEEYYYEPNPFAMNINGRDTTYTPDFFILSRGFVEVKGYDDAKLKFEYFISIPEINEYFGYELLMEKDLQKLGIDLKNKIKET